MQGGILAGKSVHYFDRPVERGVIDHDHLDGLPYLVQHTSKRRKDQFLPVIGRNDDTDGWHARRGLHKAV
jgi:hypothetical protein